MSRISGNWTLEFPFHASEVEPTPNTDAARAFSFGCGTLPTVSSALKPSFPVMRRHRSPPSVPVDVSHHCLMSFESASSSTENDPRLCVDSIAIRYQEASESLMLYSSMFGK